MSVYKEALIAFSVTGTVTFRDEKRHNTVIPLQGGTDRRQLVHLMIVECAKNFHCLVVAGLVDDTHCGYPPVLLSRLFFPDPRMSFDIKQSYDAIHVTFEGHWCFSLTFAEKHEFWEVARIISEAMAEDAVRNVEVIDLVNEAMSRHLPFRFESSVEEGAQAAEEGVQAAEEGVQTVDEGVQAVEEGGEEGVSQVEDPEEATGEVVGATEDAMVTV